MSIIGTYNMSNSEVSAKARDIMERKIEAGRASAAHLLEHINTVTPSDSVVRASALHFQVADSNLENPPVELVFGDDSRTIHKHALAQIGAKAGVPGAFLSELTAGAPWQRELAATILNEHFHKSTDAARSKYLVRTVNHEARGFLSDRFRRLDSRPLLESFALACQQVGAVPVDGHVTDTRVAMKALLPMVFEPVQGEVICLGVEWGNSDFGAAKHTVRAFVLRLWCLNGATMENSLAQVHVGRQLSEDIEFSRRTYELDTRASASALTDIVRGTLGPSKVNALVDGIRMADEKKIDWKNMKTNLARRLLKGEMQAVEAAYESEDVVNLPAGKSLWRASNAISWIAGKTEDGDRKLELQRLAGEVLNGRRDSEEREAA